MKRTSSAHVTLAARSELSSLLQVQIHRGRTVRDVTYPEWYYDSVPSARLAEHLASCSGLPPEDIDGSGELLKYATRFPGMLCLFNDDEDTFVYVRGLTPAEFGAFWPRLSADLHKDHEYAMRDPWRDPDDNSSLMETVKVHALLLSQLPHYERGELLPGCSDDEPVYVMRVTIVGAAPGRQAGVKRAKLSDSSDS